MRSSEKGALSANHKEVFGVDFHDFIMKDQQAENFETASEFGLSRQDVQKLKKRMNRS